MHQKLKYVLYTCIVMGLLPVSLSLLFYVTLLFPVPILGYLLSFYTSITIGPASIILESFRYIIPGFELSGDLPLIKLVTIFCFWGIIGGIYGLIAYPIRNKKTEYVRFGMADFILVAVLQIIISYPLTYILAMVFNSVFF